MIETIDAFLAEYIQRTNTHRFDEVAPLVHEDALFWFSSGSYRGLAEIRAAFEKTWAMIQNEVYAVDDVEWLAVDETSAVCVYTFRWRGNIDSIACEGSGRGTSVLRKAGHQWRVVHEHLSARP